MLREFVKDGKFYRIKSKYIFHKYNISPSDKREIDEKLSKQNHYLKNHHIILGDNSSISLHDISMGANIRPEKYLAELSNRVDSFKKFAFENNFLCPVFLTMTPESHFKPCKVVKTKKKDFYILADNKHFTGDFDNYVKDCRDNIQAKFRKFLNDRIFRDIKNKYGFRPPYFSSYEPSLDGALHKHSLFFVPPEFLERFISRFRVYFGFAIVKKEVYNDDLGVFETVETKIPLIHDVKTVFDDDAGGVSAYIMKYVLKSFRNSETGELTDEGYWYAKHGLMRFTSARVLLPLYIWRSIRSPELSYLEMTKKYHSNDLECHLVAKHHNHNISDFKRSNFNLSRVDHHLYDENNVYLGFETLYSRSFDNYDIVNTDVTISPAPKKINHVEICTFYPMDVFVNGVSMVFDGFNLHKSSIPLHKRSSIDLYLYFQSLDLDRVNLVHYHAVKNELIKRGVIYDSIQSLNDVSDLQYFGSRDYIYTMSELRGDLF